MPESPIRESYDKLGKAIREHRKQPSPESREHIRALREEIRLNHLRRAQLAPSI